MAKKLDSSSVEQLGERALEKLTEALLRRAGYTLTYPRGPGSIDRGWDIMAIGEQKSYLVVIKASPPTQARAIEDLHRLMSLDVANSIDGLLLVSNHFYKVRTQHALREAAGDSFLVKIWDVDELEHQLAQHPDITKRFLGGAATRTDRRPRFARLTSLHLENIRGFRNFTLQLDSPGGNVVVIGRNGTGKSTLLRAIAVAVAPEADVSTLLSHPVGTLVREGSKRAGITAKLTTGEGEQHEVHLELGSAGETTLVLGHDTTAVEGFFVCGYGTARGSTRGSQPGKYLARDAVASLFDYDTHLVDPELMLRRLQDYMGSKRYDLAMKGLRRVLGLSARHKITVARGGGVRVSGPGIGKDIPLEGWADGYRMTFQWLIDLYGWALHAEAFTARGGVEGILLIDELEQHLHPSMQTALLQLLAKLLPDTQIIATTHSPLVALGDESSEIIALHRSGSSIRRAVAPNLSGYSAQDVLVEEALFGTDPFSVKTRKKLNEQRKLAALAKGERTAAQRKRLAQLAAELGPADKPATKDDPVLEELRTLRAMIERRQAKT